MSFAVFVVTTLLLAQHPSGTTAPALNGTWRSTPDETPLSSTFDESVWGKNAKAIRTVEMVVRAGGDASLTVTRKVVDARGRTVVGSSSVEQAELTLGSVQNTTGVRSELMVTVKKAERRYPDDPKGTFDLQGLQVTVTTFSDDAEMLAFQPLISERGDVFEPAAFPGNESVGRAIIGVGALRNFITLRKSHDHVATMGRQGHSYETGRLGEEGVVQFLLKFFRKQFGKLVFKAGTLFVGEREIAGVGANPQDSWIDQFDGQIGAVLLRLCDSQCSHFHGSGTDRGTQQPSAQPGTQHFNSFR